MWRQFLEEFVAGSSQQLNRLEDVFEGVDDAKLAGLEIELRRSKRRKKSMTMRYENGRLLVMVPSTTRDSQIRQWLREKQAWVISQIEQAWPEQRYALGECYWYLGKRYPLREGRHEVMSVGAGLVCLDDEHDCLRIQTSSSEAAIRAGIRDWYQRQAKEHLPPRLDELSQLTGLVPKRLEIKYYKSRWGSCTQRGVVQLNWRLMMAPEAVIDYVLIHELCHLKHLNHSKTFWALVEKHCPAHRTHRGWLKQHAAQLALP